MALLILGVAVVVLLSRGDNRSGDSDTTVSDASVATLPTSEGGEPAPPAEAPVTTEGQSTTPIDSPENPAPIPEAERAEIRPKEAAQKPIEEAVPANVPRTTATPPPTPPPPVPAPDPIPERATVNVVCQGLSDACGTIVSALEQSLEKNSMPLVRGNDAEISVEVFTEEIEARQEQQFGTLFVVRTYSIEVTGSARRFDEMVRMPPPETFSFDTRFGREKLSERARVLADAVTEKILAYWNAKARNP
jgi:hypothetical protein